MEYTINQAVDKIQSTNITIVTQVDSLLKEQRNFIGDIIKDTVNKIEEQKLLYSQIHQFQSFNAIMNFTIC
jgi:uncharacterized membrane-anchored protein YjiN (DUF445 family)